MTTQTDTPKQRWSLVETPRAASIHVAGEPYAPHGRIVASASGNRSGTARGVPVRWLGVDPRVLKDLQEVVDKLNAHDALVTALEKIRAEESCSPVIAFIADEAIKLAKASSR